MEGERGGNESRGRERDRECTNNKIKLALHESHAWYFYWGKMGEIDLIFRNIPTSELIHIFVISNTPS